MVAEIIAGPITEITSIWKKGKDKPLLIKSHADDRTIYDSAALMTSQKTEDLNCVLNALSSWSSLTLT